MTPLQRACLEMGSFDDPVDMKLTQAVVSAYLEAIAEDAETVEAVTLSLTRTTAEHFGDALPVNPDLSLTKLLARAALLALSTISGGEKG